MARKKYKNKRQLKSQNKKKRIKKYIFEDFTVETNLPLSEKEIYSLRELMSSQCSLCLDCKDNKLNNKNKLKNRK
ncbi:MAG: hypothetical protein ACTSPH_07935 [Promethearchaeota archaeon]